MYSSSSFCARYIIKSCIAIRQTLPCANCLARQVHSWPVTFSPHSTYRSIHHAQSNTIVKQPLLQQCVKQSRLSYQVMVIHGTTQKQCKNTGKEGSVEPLEDNIEEWIHPDNRQDQSSIFKDPELKGLLRELAADFGEGDSMAGKQEADVVEEDVAVTFDGGTVVKKDVVKGTSQNDVTIPKKKKDLPPVFDVDGITDLLREENASDMCVIRVPRERQYVDYFIVVTAHSTRHLHAMTQSVNKIYKQRKSSKHAFVSVEGKGADDWMCLDFGNIVVHFMIEEIRELYELEKLWLLGPEYDDHVQRMKKHQESLRQALAAVPEPMDGGMRWSLVEAVIV